MGLRQEAHLLNRVLGYSDRLTETEKQAFNDMRKRLRSLKPLSEKQLAWVQGVLSRLSRKR